MLDLWTDILPSGAPPVRSRSTWRAPSAGAWLESWLASTECAACAGAVSLELAQPLESVLFCSDCLDSMITSIDDLELGTGD